MVFRGGLLSSFKSVPLRRPENLFCYSSYLGNLFPVPVFYGNDFGGVVSRSESYSVCPGKSCINCVDCYLSCHFERVLKISAGFIASLFDSTKIISFWLFVKSLTIFFFKNFQFFLPVRQLAPKAHGGCPPTGLFLPA